MSPRAKAVVPLVVTYWVVLCLGLGLYTAARTDAPGVLGVLWGGCIFGTLVGHTMGLTNIRFWFTTVIVGALLALGLAGPSSPDTKLFWMTFTPAAISAALSVTDRWSLAAFWFPAMIWMLTVLDGTHGKASPDGTAAVLLGALALAFIIFLRARESRRVALWRVTSTTPLAAPVASTVFKERPGKELGRASWMLATSAIVFAFTAWIAPHLWEVETFAGDPKTIAANGGPAGAGAPTPCCEQLLEAERKRVKEYFDFGRGHDAFSGTDDTEPDCRKCSGDGGDGPGPARAWRHGELVPLYWCTEHEIEVGICVPVESWSGIGGYASGGGGGGGGGGTGGYGGYGGHDGTGTGGGGGHGSTGIENWARPTPNYEPPQPYVPPTPTPIPEVIEPTPPIVQPEPPVVAQPEPPYVPPTPTPPPVDIPNVRPEPPAPVVAPAPEPPAPAVGSAPSTSSAPPVASQTQKPASTSHTGELLRWLSAFVAAVIALQLFRFLFRPLRRAIALRHLRKPFWEETVDQRVSNWWQLVLVGLRDAGWRTSADEPPREFARRVGIDGVDKCASILDRTRHGIRIDHDDLEEMARSAEAAYASARANTGTVARAAAQIRWPLA